MEKYNLNFTPISPSQILGTTSDFIPQIMSFARAVKSHRLVAAVVKTEVRRILGKISKKSLSTMKSWCHSHK